MDEVEEPVIEDGLDQELQNILNHPAPAYGEVEYWNNRYRGREGETFEWLEPWPVIFSKIDSYIVGQKQAALVLGCGNSQMSEELLDVVQKVHSIDISDVVINEMRERHSGESRLEWQTMDCSKLAFPNASFDYVFAKGTLDTLMCYDSATKVIEATVKEAARVLKPGGLMIVVSYGAPSTRRRYFDRGSGFTLEQSVMFEKEGVKTNHYIYIAKRVE